MSLLLNPLDIIGRIFPATKPEISVRGHMPALDGMRGMAILLVIICHFSVGIKDAVPASVFNLLTLGRHGVDFFFVLSGFLITGVLMDAKSKPRYFINFYGRRALRIFPLYYVTLAVIFLVLPAIGLANSESSQQLAANQGAMWLYYSNIVMGLRKTADTWFFVSNKVELNHFWSLAVEEQFYFVWPLVVYLLGRKQLLWAALSLVIIAVVSRIVMLSAGCQVSGAFVFTPCRLDALGIGALIAIAARDERFMARLTTWARRIGFASIIGMFLAMTLLQQWIIPFHTLKGLLLAGLFGGILVMGLSVEFTPAKAFFSRPWLRFLGKYSYGIYVFHVLLLPQFMVAFAPGKISSFLHTPALVSGLLFMILAAACSIALAMLSWVVLEKPCLSLKRYFETAKPAEPTAAPIRQAA